MYRGCILLQSINFNMCGMTKVEVDVGDNGHMQRTKQTYAHGKLVITLKLPLMQGIYQVTRQFI